MADGRAASLPAQHLLPLESPEMAIDWQQSLARLASNPEARELGARAGFGALAKPEVVAAIAAYVGSLVSGGSRFDRFYYGHDEAALTDQEQRGLRIFVRKGRCSTCHLLDGNAAPLTDGSFHSVGVGFAHGRYTDHGRIAVTGRPSDDGVFKTPSLRNVSRRPFLMHDGSMGSLQQVVAYYNRGGTPTAVNQDPRIRPLFLSDEEVGDLVAFLVALDAPVVLVSSGKH